ncbi:hypothetical protein V6Z11_D11G340800 [Gossypium hirsutum]
MKELGELKHFLGLEVEHTKPISTPMDLNIKLRADERKHSEDVTMHGQLVESLIYLTLSRQDITYIVEMASRHMSNPKKAHLDVVRLILRHVKGNINFGILYKKIKECLVARYCDADYAEDYDMRQLTTGYIFGHGLGAIS